MTTGASKTNETGYRRGVLAAALLATSALVSLATIQTAAAQQNQIAAPSGGMDQVYGFAIAAQPMSGALIQFGRQTGMQVSVDGALLEGLSAPAISGRMRGDQALQQLLSGSGLIYAVEDSTITITKAPGNSADGALMLDPVYVNADADAKQTSAYEPVRTYVASRTATGTKTDTPISEVPQSISVVTEKQMKQRGVQSVGEAVAYSAGAAVNLRGDTAGLGGDAIALRGFGGNGTAGTSYNEYWDGLRMSGTNYVTSGLASYLYERVEIMRGPSSVLYGQNQPGGVINRVSKRPDPDAKNEVQVQYGSFNSKEVDFDLGGAVTDNGRMSYRLVGVVLDEDAQMDYSGLDRKSLQGSVTLLPSDDTTLTLQANYQYDDVPGKFWHPVPAVGTITNSPYGTISRSTFTGDPNYDEWLREMAAIGYSLDHVIDDTWTFRQNARYYRNELDSKVVYMNSLQADQRTANRVAFGADESSSMYTIDNQGEAKFATGAVDHTALVGLDYQYNRRDTVRYYGTAPTLDLYNPVYNQTIVTPPLYQNVDYTTEQLGLYAQDQIKYENWILTLGGRQDWANNDTINRRTGATQTSWDKAFTGRGGLGYAFQNGVTPYLSYSQSFEPTSGVDAAGKAFKPTEGEQYELGVKYEPHGLDAMFTASLFQITQTNVLTTDPNNTSFSIQTGEVESKGIELESAVEFGGGWSMTAAYSYLDAEVTKSNSTNLGKRPTLIPEHQASIWGHRTFEEGSLQGLGAGMGVRHVSSSAGDAANTFKVPAYTLLDASISYDLGVLDEDLKGASAGISATNLTDEIYIASCQTALSCVYGTGRTITGRVTYEW